MPVELRWMTSLNPTRRGSLQRAALAVAVLQDHVFVAVGVGGDATAKGESSPLRRGYADHRDVADAGVGEQQMRSMSQAFDARSTASAA
jgi:hypothetical protein